MLDSREIIRTASAASTSSEELSGAIDNMPPLPPAPGVTRAVMNMTCQGVPVANVMHFTAPPGPGAPDPVLLGERIAGYWISTLRGDVHTQLILQNVVCTDLSASGPPSSIITTGLPSAGTNAAQPYANNAALVMSLHTALRGRSFRGRIYTMGFTESDVSGNNVLGAFRDTMVANYSGFILFTEIGEPDYQLVVLSYYSGGSLRSEGLATPVTTITADTLIDTQRRRMR